VAWTAEPLDIQLARVVVVTSFGATLDAATLASRRANQDAIAYGTMDGLVREHLLVVALFPCSDRAVPVFANLRIVSVSRLPLTHVRRVSSAILVSTYRHDR
jgi:hypothetical protein